jgi:hypothetical protein
LRDAIAGRATTLADAVKLTPRTRMSHAARRKRRPLATAASAPKFVQERRRLRNAARGAPMSHPDPLASV